MRLVIMQTLTLWLLAGIGFWAAFVALGLRFEGIGPPPERPPAPVRSLSLAISSYRMAAAVVLGVGVGLWAGLA